MRVLIVDDVQLFRSTLKKLLVSFCSISEGDIYEADDVKSGLEKYAEVQPQLVFLDIVMPEIGGVEAVSLFLENYADAKIIMCSSLIETDSVMNCLAAGALDYILKPLTSAERLKEAIAVAMSNSK